MMEEIIDVNAITKELSKISIGSLALDKLISGVLRYRMPIEHVIKLVSQLQLTSESINTWKVGVERALKKYVCEETQQSEKEDEHEGKE